MVMTNASGVKTLSLVFEAPADGQACTYGLGDGTVLTVRLHKNDKDAVLPGRHLSESQVAEIAAKALPEGTNLRCDFKDGVWEVLEVQKDAWGVASQITNANGKITIQSTNATRLVLRVRDADGNVEPLKTP